MIILDISDKAHPKMVSRWDYHPPYHGLHPHRRAVLRAQPADRQRRMRAQRRRRLAEAGVDRRRPHRGKPGADRDLPDAAGRDLLRAAAAALARTISGRTCRRKAAGNPTRSSSAPSSTAACAPTTLANPYQPKEVAYFVPHGADGAPTGACQINDVFVDDRGIVFTVDRHVGGLYMLEMDF